MKSELFRLLKNIITIGTIIIAGYYAYNYFFKEASNELTIDKSPMHIESIKAIAEIATISYKDEVVMDSIEFYRSEKSVYDPREWIRIYDRNIKRRITLIVKGEVKYGINLNDENYSIRSNTDTIWLYLPTPGILDVLVSPSRTEIFQESGIWTDTERKKIELLAKQKLKRNAKKLNLGKKAKVNVIRFFKSIIDDRKVVIITFNHD
ncbi:MAG: DUF4230 domain-containing protein [Flavobacteriales bacterium]|nr:DUF4230 domain-containing protein [Flavobacteriales bacterium]